MARDLPSSGFFGSTVFVYFVTFVVKIARHPTRFVPSIPSSSVFVPSVNFVVNIPLSGAKGLGTEEVFLNNALLENGQAVRKEEWEFGDWEKGW